MNTYKDRVLTVSDLNSNECGSSFDHCTFNMSSDDPPKGFNGFNFSFALFTDCVFNAIFSSCNFTGVVANNLPSPDKLISCNMNVGSGPWGNRTDYLNNLPCRLELTAVPSSIKADGVSSSVITIRKKNFQGSLVTNATDDISIENTRGKLNALTAKLSNGVASVTLTSVSETCTSTVQAKSSVQNVLEGSSTVQFVP